MPQFIRTPEDIFRAERRDVYALHFCETTSKAIQKTWQEMKAWFEQHMPDSPTEMMGPSEHSGWIEGGPSALRIAAPHGPVTITCFRRQQWLQGWRTPVPAPQCDIVP